MVIGTNDPEAIPPSHWKALLESSAELVDEILDELADVDLRTWTFADSPVLSLLPQAYVLKYTPQFMRQFLICVSTVGWKLAQEKYYLLSCVAEEFALHAIMENAVAIMELNGYDATINDFDGFMEEAYEDTDFLMLFDPSLDGIDDSWVGRTLRIGHLKFEEWFIPFGEGSREQIHPYLPGSVAAEGSPDAS